MVVAAVVWLGQASCSSWATHLVDSIVIELEDYCAVVQLHRFPQLYHLGRDLRDDCLVNAEARVSEIKYLPLFRIQ